jgi:DNA-binding transcriptional regulator GbsR (MarR family)
MSDADLDRWLPAWMALLRVYPRYFDYVESEMRREHGLTMPRYDVLAHLDLAGGRLGLSELATRIWLSPSGLSKLLDRMESSGLIVREPDPRDARSWFAGESHHALLASTFGSALNSRDVADLVRAMRRLGASFGSHNLGLALTRNKERQPMRRITQLI